MGRGSLLARHYFEQRDPQVNTAPARQKQTAALYHDYYAAKGKDRNDPLRNAGVLFQNLAFYRSIVEALRRIEVCRDWKILDVGCGSGFSLLRLMSFGLEPEQLTGIDIREDRIQRGKRRIPSLDLRHADATALPFPDAHFDLVTESTMFTQMTDEAAASAIAGEMLRVTRPGGYILLTDWRYSFGRNGYAGLSGSRVARLFRTHEACAVICVRKGALLPPLGRAISRFAPALYFPVSTFFPFLVGQVSVVLQTRPRPDFKGQK